MFFRALIFILFWVSVAMNLRDLHERWETQFVYYVAPNVAINLSDWKRGDCLESLGNHIEELDFFIAKGSPPASGEVFFGQSG
jgi:hypothetical protein